MYYNIHNTNDNNIIGNLNNIIITMHGDDNCLLTKMSLAQPEGGNT